MIFPSTKIISSKMEDGIEFDTSISPIDSPDLLVHDESIIECSGSSTTVDTYMTSLYCPDTRILPRIDLKRRCYIFKQVHDEDDLFIRGRRFEVRSIRYGSGDDCEYEWFVKECH